MSLRRKLESLLDVIIEEASKNSEFEVRLLKCLSSQATPKDAVAERIEPWQQVDSGEVSESSRPKNRRAQAVLEPVSLIREGEDVLRAELEKLDLEQLRDIVAEYGMDSGRLVMKWVRPSRVIDRIVEISSTRANKGHAFRRQED